MNPIWKNLKGSFFYSSEVPCGLLPLLYWTSLLEVIITVNKRAKKGIKKDWKLGDQIYLVASNEGPMCHCSVATVQSRDGGPIPFALASHVAGCLDSLESAGYTWSANTSLGCFFFVFFYPSYYLLK